ncbi:unnamed protein product [Brassica oleracea]
MKALGREQMIINNPEGRALTDNRAREKIENNNSQPPPYPRDKYFAGNYSDGGLACSWVSISSD